MSNKKKIVSEEQDQDISPSYMDVSKQKENIIVSKKALEQVIVGNEYVEQYPQMSYSTHINLPLGNNVPVWQDKQGNIYQITYINNTFSGVELELGESIFYFNAKRDLSLRDISILQDLIYNHTNDTSIHAGYGLLKETDIIAYVGNNLEKYTKKQATDIGHNQENNIKQEHQKISTISFTTQDMVSYILNQHDIVGTFMAYYKDKLTRHLCILRKERVINVDDLNNQHFLILFQQFFAEVTYLHKQGYISDKVLASMHKKFGMCLDISKHKKFLTVMQTWYPAGLIKILTKFLSQKPKKNKVVEKMEIKHTSLLEENTISIDNYEKLYTQLVAEDDDVQEVEIFRQKLAHDISIQLDILGFKEKMNDTITACLKHEDGKNINYITSYRGFPAVWGKNPYAILVQLAKNPVVLAKEKFGPTSFTYVQITYGQYQLTKTIKSIVDKLVILCGIEKTLLVDVINKLKKGEIAPSSEAVMEFLSLYDIVEKRDAISVLENYHGNYSHLKRPIYIVNSHVDYEEVFDLPLGKHIPVYLLQDTERDKENSAILLQYDALDDNMYIYNPGEKLWSKIKYVSLFVQCKYENMELVKSASDLQKWL